MRVGFLTWTKSWVSIAELLEVQRIALAASGEKSKWKRLSHVWQIVKILTVVRWPLSVFLYPRIVAAFKFKADENASNDTLEDIEKRVMGLSSDLASRCGKLPREILTGMAFPEVEMFYKNLVMRRLEAALELMSAYHAPVSFGKSTTDRLRKLQNELTRTAEPRAVLDKPDAFEPVSIKGMFPRFA